MKKDRLLDIDGRNKGIYEKVREGLQSNYLSPSAAQLRWDESPVALRRTYWYTEDIAAQVAFLLSRKAASLTGQPFVADNGVTRTMIYVE